MNNPEFIKKLIENFNFNNIEDFDDDEDVDTALQSLSSDYTAIDLGLPSGLKWASTNIGADAPESLGLYFQYAGTTGVSIDNIPHEVTAPYLEGDETHGKWTKYNKEDKLDVLQPKDDAATVNCGPYWRMPTRSEIRELYNNCKSEYVDTRWTQGKDRAIIVFTSKTNGNSITVPAGGIIVPDFKSEETGSVAFICSDRGPDMHGFSLGVMDVNVVESEKTIWDRYLRTEYYRQLRRVAWAQVRPVSDKL